MQRIRALFFTFSRNAPTFPQKYPKKRALFHLFYPPKAAFLHFYQLLSNNILNSMHNKDLHKYSLRYTLQESRETRDEKMQNKPNFIAKRLKDHEKTSHDLCKTNPISTIENQQSSIEKMQNKPKLNTANRKLEIENRKSPWATRDE